MEANGTATNAFPKLQFGFQCIDNTTGKVIQDGDCTMGGTGYKCPCPDLMLQDPRIDAVFKGYPIVDPRTIATSILFLASDEASAVKVNGETFVVGNSLDDTQAWGCASLVGPPLKQGSCGGATTPQPWHA